ncbi:MAG TPA: endonuclease III domain-containing protein [Gammaproteobacteria bacterium]
MQNQLEIVYARLLKAYGPQHWWPADDPFEVMVGAVLTQNTAWLNVEKAIKSLKQSIDISAEAILALADDELAALIRPSGYFNIKTRRLKNLCQWFLDEGGFAELLSQDTGDLREALLSIKGIGPETADDILLYAFERPVFVIDLYTRRLFSRLGLVSGDEDYETLRHLFETAMPANVPIYNEYHALIVRHAKETCSKTGDCRHCWVESADTEF